MKTIGNLLFFLLITLSVKAQNPFTGKWYSFARNFNITEANFQNAQLNIRRFDYTLTNPNKTDSADIHFTRVISNRIYYMVQNHRTPDGYYLIGFVQTADKKHFTLLLNSFKKFTTEEGIENFIRQDILQDFPGIKFYSEKEFLKMKTFTPFSFITREDFKKYLYLNMESLKKAEAIKNDSTYTDQLKLYHETIFKDNIYFSGYCPIVSEEEFTGTINKYRKDLELRPLIEKIAQWNEEPIGME
jgi:hypothetical protein